MEVRLTVLDGIDTACRICPFAPCRVKVDEGGSVRGDELTQKGKGLAVQERKLCGGKETGKVSACSSDQIGLTLHIDPFACDACQRPEVHAKAPRKVEEPVVRRGKAFFIESSFFAGALL